ncbi:MAG: FliM/FliN family flagellar motor switch protein [Comamonadaceae bacterium]|nr:MAG: FliM/FliN family flagellar motor switch protein [Comamonadaceae bacterium]
MSAFCEAAAFPLHARSAGQLARGSATIDAALEGWAAAWGLDLAGAGATFAVSGPHADIERATLLGRRGDAAAWMLGGAALLHRIHLLLFGCERSIGTIAEEVALACEKDLLARLRAATGLAAGEAHAVPPDRCRQPWSGWVQAQLPLGIGILLSPEAVASTLQGTDLDPSPRGDREAAPLAPLRDALSTSAFELHAELEGCEVSIGALRELQRGDVLRLRQRLDAPAVVRERDGSVLFSGFLVRRGARRALELARHPHQGKP